MERKNIIDRIKSRFRREPDGLEDILYKKLKKFQNTPLHLRSREQYDELLYTVTSNKDTLYELLFSKKLKKDDNCELMVIGMFGEHQLAEDDAEWPVFINRLNERHDELSGGVKHYIDGYDNLQK